LKTYISYISCYLSSLVMLPKTCTGTSAAAAAAAVAVALLTALLHVHVAAAITTADASIYDGSFTSAPRDDDLLHAIESCDHSVSCAGISLASNGTVESHTIYEHTFVGPYVTPKTHETYKPYTYHRGEITRGNIISTETGLTLRDAKKYCTDHDNCVAFSYPLRSLTGLNYLPNVTFYSTLEEFEPSEMDDYRSYVSNDVTRTSPAGIVNADALPYDEKVAQRPYRGCCTRTDVPTLAEVEAADTTLERISCNITREEFFLKYEVPRKPVMLVGCDADWPARTEWTYDTLAPRFYNESKWRARLGGKTEDYEKIEWGVLANAMAENKPFYVFDQLQHEEGKKLEADYVDPLPMQGGNLYQQMNDRDIYWAGPLRWFCVGKFGSGTKSHIDPFSSDAWNSLIRGHKWWIIYPEGVTDRDTFCEGACSSEDPLTRQWYGSVGVNAARTEYPNDKYAYHVLQKPGETIYVPDGIVHSVFNMDATVAVTRNYGSAANLDNVWEQACTSGDERKWKIMYNLVLNREQRRRVRSSRYYPFDKNCVRKTKGRMRDGTADGKNRPKPEFLEKLWHPSFDPQVGDVVEARYNGDHNEWYKGVVTRITTDGLYNIKYDDDERDTGLTRMSIRQYIPPRVGEIIQAKMIGHNGEELWVLATVLDLKSDGTVDVRHIDGRVYESLPKSFIQRFDWRFEKGSRVKAMWKQHGWFDAVIAEVNEDGTYDVQFDDGDFRSGAGRDDIRFVWAHFN